MGGSVRRTCTATPNPQPCAPSGDIVAIRVEDLGEKEAVLAAGHKGFFTIPHFDGYPAVLVQLKAVGKRAYREALVDGWVACAPPNLAAEYLKR
ncbi:MAG: hypothetical protein ACRDYF_06980 [Acidimicrobiia bacterium]